MSSSPVTMFRFGFCLLLIISFIVAITSYKIDHQQYENRNKRAVTEWRFRRGSVRLLPYFDGNDANDDLAEREIMDNDAEYPTKIYNKKYLPHLSYHRIY